MEIRRIKKILYAISVNKSALNALVYFCAQAASNIIIFRIIFAFLTVRKLPIIPFSEKIIPAKRVGITAFNALIIPSVANAI